MLTSARNELEGTIIEVTSGGVMSEVVVKVTDEISISSTITNNSKDRLGLKVGENVSLLIKSSFVILSKEHLRATARNNIKVKVTEVIKGAVNGEVKLALGATTLCSVIT
ncbi:MAG: TOBE domain-containing protein, partial [Sulfurimonadaceae bacterium]|nr:TOBE domain-containing protein [Sulfurimonadaceae bacterium]